MEFNYRFLSRALDVIQFPGNMTSGSSYSCISHNANNVYQKFVYIPISNSIEVPCFCRGAVEDAICKNLHNGYDFTEIIYPLTRQGYPDRKRTGDAIVASLFDWRNFGIFSVIDGKGNSYYGSKGLIMDKDFTPLLMATITINVNSTDRMIEYKGTTIRINPIVFDRTDGVVEKVIIKKLINLYSTREVEHIESSTGTLSLDKRESKKATIIINDFSNFFVTPNVPSITNCSSEELNQLLVDNIIDIQ